MAEKIIKKIAAEGKRIEKEQEYLKELEILSQYEGDDEVVSSKQAWEELAEEHKKPIPKFFSKIPTLDRFVDGFRQGDLVVISGPTKQGKTTLAQTITTNLSEDDISCLWFSYEMSQREFFEKFGVELPYFSLPKQLRGNSIDWIETRVKEGIAKFGTKIVFIDHLHFLMDMSWIGQSRGNSSLVIGAIMRELKKIAIRNNVAIILIAHTTKMAFDKQPELVDIRDSSFISQEADTVLMMWRIKDKETKEFGNKAILAVLANRRTGANGKIKLILQNNHFTELTDQYDSE